MYTVMAIGPLLLLQAGEPYSHCSNIPTSVSRHRLGQGVVTVSPFETQVDRRTMMHLAFGLTGAASIFTSTTVAHAMTIDPKTGISFPDPGEIENAIPSDWTGVENPFIVSDSKAFFGRLDTTPDAIFYAEPRFVEHVDENAVQLLTSYISNDVVKEDYDVLDLCSSWTSHLDSKVVKSLGRVAGLGLNPKELKANSALTEWTVQDLNLKAELPYKDGDFDVVLCQLSIDYLTKPLDVLREVGRVLKPGGTVHVLFSNRLFLSKAVGLWTGADDIDHAYYVGSYLYFCGGNFTDIAAKDLSTRKGREKRIIGDPLYLVRATKSA